MEFIPINTQEEFDTRVQEVYGDVKDLQGQISTLTGERDTHAGTIAELQKQVKQYQTNEMKQRIARQKGIPAEMASRLTGETEQEIAADAAAMAAIFKKAKGPAPLFQQEPSGEPKSAALSEMLSELRGE